MTTTTHTTPRFPVPTVVLGSRPDPAGPWAAARVFAWRSLLKIRHVPEQLSDVIAVPIIFTLLFTYLFGGALAGSTHRYLQFLLPGTLVMAVLLATMYTGINLNADLDKGVYDRFRTLPIWRPAPIVGALLGDTLRYLLASTLVVGLGLALGFRPHGGVDGTALGMALVIAFASALSWVFCWLGLLLRSANSIMSLAMVVLFPLTMASNTFVQPATMPGWLRDFVDVNPVSHLVTTTRAAMAGTVIASQVVGVLLTTLATIAVFAPLTLRAYSRKP
ncbi:ABC transporter permease [Catenulispora rubra]|uniref:ABC transporter permease n=1 Tax=Catenulispora rubra TaxID=280293 RepID=UPI0018923FEC|nr:ABC transporter permease [Catenulispora rubra]